MNSKSFFIYFLVVTALYIKPVFSESFKFSNPKIEKKVLNLTKDFDAPRMTFNQLDPKQKYMFLDAREKSEYNVSHIQNALHVGYEDFDLKRVMKKLDPEKPIIVYCSIGYRSGKIAEKLKAQGFKVYNLMGGIFEWINNDQVVYDNKNNKTLDIHGYNQDWSKWIEKGNIKLKP